MVCDCDQELNCVDELCAGGEVVDEAGGSGGGGGGGGGGDGIHPK